MSTRKGGESSRRSHREGGNSSPRVGGGAWAPLDVAGVPPAKRSNHSMLPAADGRLVIFGGFDGTGFLGDVTAAILDKQQHRE